jgi:glycosyltransferase involved in cell wall biosynthesis
MSSTRICLIPKVSGTGGMVSFRQRLTAGLVRRGLQVCDDLDDGHYDSVLVIGGTRQLGGLWRARQRGARIVQRLDGRNWLHRLRKTGLRHFLRAEYGNWNLSWIRTYLAQWIVYQSEFARDWWERAAGATAVPNRVIYNGVDLSVYTPEGPGQPPAGRWRLLLVEGSLMGGYELGMEAAVGLASELSQRRNDAHSRISQESVELMVVGRVPAEIQARWQQRSPAPIVWAGLQPLERIPELDRSAHLLYSADLNPACPNAVIEALACGLPVVAFDTGALPELVVGDAGRVVPYGGDPWRLAPPDIPALGQAALEILADQERFRHAARARAQATFDLDEMVEKYLEVLL